uniref:Carbohydrate sulfotransferase n=1 Tax=Cyprinus carpio carpio TaxID=630221 RepID=A0A9J8A066_CYPCA
MIVLSQNLKAPDGAPYLDPLDIPYKIIHNHTVHKTFNKLWRRFGHYSRPLMHHKLKNYTKFLFVRDPFVRLISAFRDKFVKPDEYFYSHYGSTMLQRYANISKPPDSAKEAFAAGYENRTAVDWEGEWFANISVADRRKLYNLYETDYKLFEYDKPETLLDE